MIRRESTISQLASRGSSVGVIRNLYERPESDGSVTKNSEKGGGVVAWSNAGG